MAQLIVTADQDGSLVELLEWVQEVTNDCLAPAHPGCETHKPGTKVVLRLSNYLEGCSETLAARLNDCLKTLETEMDDCFETLLKILKGFKDSFLDIDTSSIQDPSITVRGLRLRKAVAEVTNAENRWCLEKMLQRTGEKQRAILERQESDAAPFVSWLIQGASNPRIQSPYSLAIANLIERPRIGAGGAYNRLATLAPERLVSLLEQRFSLCRPTNKDWEIAFGNTSLDRNRLLIDLLNIPIELLEVER